MINRCAVVVTAKQPLVEWLHFVETGELNITLESARSDPNVYLLPETDCPYPELLVGAWEPIFEAELEQWYTDEALWPPRRTLQMFLQWFECSFHSMITDLCVEPLLDDEA